MNIPRNNLELYDLFAANRERLMDRQWLEDALRPHCLIKRMGWRGSRLRIIQFPSEFAQWLILLAQNKVRSYVEIGTSTGGSFFTVDSYLRSAVDGYERSVGYDRTSKLRDWEAYHARFPTCTFRHENSDKIQLGDERFDAAFIDAFHKEAWVMADYEKVRHHCRIVGFHDIVLVGASVDRAWERIKRGRVHHEFIDQFAPVEARCGIGCVLNE